MHKRSLTQLALAGFSMSAIALALVGCGGGTSPVSIPAAGKVVDGYVSGATVTFDVNGDGKCDAADNSLTAKTDASGNFNFPVVTGKDYTKFMACASGGTDISTGAAFVGTLKAPAGATQITPLTTLVQATIDAAPAGAKPTPAAAATTVATKLNLTGTDLLTTDPVAVAATNPKLAQTTVAVQTLLIQAANNVAAAATGSAATATQTAALYNAAVTGVASAVANSVATVDLTDKSTTGATAATTLITSAVTNTVTAVKADTAAAATVVGVANLAPASVASAAAANIATVTQVVASTNATTLTTAPAAGTTSVALSAMQDTTATQTTALVSALLTTANVAAATNLATTAAAVTTNLTNGNAAAAATAVTTAATTAGVTIPTVTAPTLTAPTNVVELSAPMANAVAVNTAGSPYTVTVTGPLTTASLSLTGVGTPVFSNPATVGFDVVEASPGKRVLKLIVDNVQFSNNAGAITVTVPAAAKLYAYGVHSDGVTVSTAVLSNVAANVLSTTAGVMTVNWSNALTSLSGQQGFSNLSLIKGTFNVSGAISGVPLSQKSAPTAVAVKAGLASVTIPASTTIPGGLSVAGQGESFVVTVQ